MAKAKTARIPNPDKNLAIVPGGNGVTAVESKQNLPAPSDVEGEIRRRAYELYEKRGCTPGHEHEDWLIAEREIEAQVRRRA